MNASDSDHAADTPNRTPLTALKEKMLGAAAKAMLNQKFEQVGVVTGVDLNLQNKSLRLEMDLKGETVPVVVTANYELRERDDATFIVPRNFGCSRPWIGVLLNQYVAGSEVRVPNSVRLAL